MQHPLEHHRSAPIRPGPLAAPSVSPSSSSASLPHPLAADPTVKAKKTRTRDGCRTCRARKKSCDKTKPRCQACVRLALHCEWEDPVQAAKERREKRERRKAEKAAGGTGGFVDPGERERRDSGASGSRLEDEEDRTTDETGSRAGGTTENLDTLEAAGLLSTMSDYAPTPAPADPIVYDYASHGQAMLPLHPSVQHHDEQPSWTPFLGSFAPAPYTSANGPGEVAWTTSFPQLVAPGPMQPIQQHLHSTQHQQVALISNSHQPTVGEPSTSQLPDLDLTSWLSHADPPLTFSSLVRSPSPVRPFDPDLSALFPSIGDIDILNFPSSAVDQLAVTPFAGPGEHFTFPPSPPHPPPPSHSYHPTSRAVAPPSSRSSKPLPRAISHAASFLASSDFAFTQAYLLSHYTTSLAQHVSIASSSTSRRCPSSSPTSHSTSVSANLFLSLIPHAHENPFLMHSILSWSSANLAAASSTSPPGTSSSASSSSTGSTPNAEGRSGTGNASAMANLSDELGGLAEGLLSEEIAKLGRRAPSSSPRQGRASSSRDGSTYGEAKESVAGWEVVLASVLMLCQAAICRGDVEKWRERLKQCRTPLARQLARNLLYHDVLSSSSSKHGLLLDYSSLRNAPSSTHHGPNGTASASSRTGRSEGGTPASSRVSPAGTTGREPDVDADAEDGEEEDEGVLDTLMGLAEPVFLLIGRITSLAREKHEANKRNSGMIPEDELAVFLRKIDDVKGQLELEQARVDSFVVDRPDLEPHRYFHEVFRLAALLYLQMVSEVPPRAYPVLLLVRKMLSLFEAIVKERLPGLCSCHFALYVMHLNSTPLSSPHSPLTDRQRSTRVFDAHMESFTFLNTKRSRALIAEAWRRSDEGRLFVDPDEIMRSWGWHLNFA
ncbi:hypothetical protein JCM10212_001524 [Sporobolomyces blumeae]